MDIVNNIRDKANKFRQARAKLVYDHFTRGLQVMIDDNSWYSSAQNLERQLHYRGVVSIPKLYYEYKFPGNLKNFEFDAATLFERCFPAVYENYLLGFTSNKTKKNLFINAKTTAKDDLSAFFGFCICLALSNVKNLKLNFEETATKCMDKVYQMAEEIWRLNPELQHIKDYKNRDFVNGAIYGFSPREIEFFIDLQNRRKNRPWDYEISGKDEEVNHIKRNKQKIEAFTLEHLTYFLAPDTSDKIVQAINDFQNSQIQEYKFFENLSAR